MDPGNFNPYAPPKSTCTPVDFAYRRPQGSWGLSFAAGVYFFLYTGFTLLLLMSPAGDHAAGKLLLLNIPTLIALVVYTTRSKRLGVFICNTFVGLQIAITISMFRIEGADWRAILWINAIIVAPILSTSMIVWLLEILQNPKNQN